MKHRVRQAFWGVTILLVLLFSAMRTVPVFADDGAPPAGSTPAPSADSSSTDVTTSDGAGSGTDAAAPASADAATADTTSGDTSTTDVAPADSSSTGVTTDAATDAAPAPTEAAPTDAAPTDAATDAAPAPTEAAPANPTATEAAPASTEAVSVDATATDVAPTNPAPTDDASAADLLTQIPEGTDVVVTDAAGNTVPLASQAAADIIASGDPMWCPVGAMPGSSSCSGGFGSFAGVLTWLSGHNNATDAKAGVIWIEGNYDSSTNDPSVTSFVINGSDLNFWTNYSLTLKGGWGGCNPTCVSTTSSSNPSTFDGATLTIQNWNADITLSDIEITGIADGLSTALTIDTTKKVTLTRVNVHDNAGAGADIYSGAKGTAAAVTISASQFNGSSGGDGLHVESLGAITLTDVDADTNSGGTGAYLDNCLWDTGTSKCLGLGGITLTGANTFSENGSRGLDVHTSGAINASNIIADENGGRGAWLDNCGYVYDFTASCTAGTGALVNLSGTNEFKYDGGGLAVFTDGAITLHNITITDTQYGTGAWIDNSNSTVLGGAPVTLTGYGTFNGNAETGLWVSSRGLITLNNVLASSNGQSNYYQEGVGGAIDPSAGAGVGVFLENCGVTDDINPACTLTGMGPGVSMYGNNFFDGNYYAGLYIFTRGAITVNNLAVNDSHADSGAILDNWAAGTVAPQSITLLGYGSFDNNAYSGLGAHSYGAITLNNISSTNNGYWGAYVDNCRYNSSTGTCTGSLAKAVAINGTNTFSDNGMAGLEVHSLGMITLSKVDANGNTEFGAWLDNDHSGASAGVTISSYGHFNDNGFGASDPFAYFPDGSAFGLNIASRGALMLTLIQANGNQNYGARLDNTDGTGGITLAASTTDPTSRFNDNGCVTWSPDWSTCDVTYAGDDYGLWATSNGAIKVTGLRARWNGSFGALLDNHTGTPAAGVTLDGSWTAATDNYGGDGLDVYSRGAITVANLTSKYNAGNGAVLDNCGYSGGNCTYPISTSAVSLTNTPTSSIYLYQNGLDGLDVFSYGNITIMDIDSDENGQSNFYAADNNYSIDPTMGFGAYIDNSHGTGTVTIGTARANWWNTFSNNFLSGLEIYSAGAVTLKSMSADGNGGYQVDDTFDGDGLTTGYDPQYDPGYGVYVDNTSGGAKPVMLVGYNDFNWNYYSGLWIETSGAITASNLTANGNYGEDPVDSWGAWGAVLGMNHFTGANAPQSVMLTGYNQFNNNYFSGLEAYSNGTITLNNLDAENNGGTGVWIDNSGSPALTPPNVAINGYSNLDWNGANLVADGLTVLTHGNITAANLDAQGNSGNGAYLDNCGYDPNALPQPTCTLSVPKTITLTGANSFRDNQQNGLWATALGQIQINQLTANGNWWDGAYLDNQWDYATGGLTLTGWGQFNSNGFGLEAYSTGAIKMSNVTANWNWTGGADIESYGGSIPQSVSLSGANFFLGNSDADALTTNENGLYVWADGDISINSLTANWNDGYGADLETYYGKITLTGVNTFKGNSLDGLDFNAGSTVSITKIMADDNYGTGGVVGQAGGAITITCGSMTNNAGYGWSLDDWWTGTIKLYGVYAYGNGTNTNDNGETVTVVRTCPLP